MGRVGRILARMLLAIAFVFAVVNGANDGGAMVASSLKAPGLRPVGSMALLAGALVVVPLVIGTQVASTISTGLVSAPDEALPSLIGAGVVAAMLVAAFLTRRGLPTSLTLAVVGGIVGTGLGAGFAVSWGTVALVLGVGAGAPVLGALLGSVLARATAILGTRRAIAGFGPVHVGAFGLQSVAYAANDGQKMFAVLAVVGSQGATSGAPPLWQLAAVAALFSLGVLVGVRPAAGTLSGGVLRAGPRDEVSAELSSATAVLGSAALGAPVSMTQSLSGALIGAGVRRGYRQVRWRAAASLAAAWVLTLPLSAAAGAAIAAVGGVG